MTNNKENSSIEIYQAENGQTQIEVRLIDETIWLSRNQMAELFDRDVKTIGKHVANLFKEGELIKDSVVANFATTASDGKVYQVEHYNLDVVISVGYRVKSMAGTQFRIWATQRLKEHLVNGYTLNQQRLEQNSKELKQALRLVEKTAASKELTTDSGRGLVELVTRYTHTFLWLQGYDEGLLEEPSGQAGGVLPNTEDATLALAALKSSLIERGRRQNYLLSPEGRGWILY